MTGQRFITGERVCLPLIRSVARGTVLSDDGHHVRVRWDDGQIGDLIRDAQVSYNAHHLQSMREARV